MPFGRVNNARPNRGCACPGYQKKQSVQSAPPFQRVKCDPKSNSAVLHFQKVPTQLRISNFACRWIMHAAFLCYSAVPSLPVFDSPKVKETKTCPLVASGSSHKPAPDCFLILPSSLCFSRAEKQEAPLPRV